MLTQILLSATVILLGIIAWFIKGYDASNKAKHTDTNHRVDTVREEHDNDVREMSKTLSKCSNQVNRLAGTVESFVKSTEKTIDRYDKDITTLYSRNEQVLKELSDIRIKAGIEARDSETRAFKKASYGETG